MTDAERVAPWEDLSLQDLRLFLAVAQAGSIRAAASQLYLSQPTLSRSVARLEKNLQVTLFVRSARGVVITDAGSILMQRARDVLNATTALRQDVAAPATKTLVLGATATSARSIFAAYLGREWIPKNPSVQIKAIEDSDSALMARLENGDCDLAVVSTHGSSRVDALQLGTVDINAWFGHSSRLAAEPGPLPVGQLASERLLVNGPGYPSTIRLQRALEAAGQAPNIVYQCSAGQTLAAMAEAGIGVAVFGATTVIDSRHLMSRQVYSADSTPLSFDLYIAWRKASASPLVKEFAVGLATYMRSARTAPPSGG